MVARDGIEPPTPAFSGPRSTTELPGLSADFALQFPVWDSGQGRGARTTNSALQPQENSIPTPRSPNQPARSAGFVLPILLPVLHWMATMTRSCAVAVWLLAAVAARPLQAQSGAAT